MQTDYIYRVTIRTAGSVQPTGTSWRKETLYCGDDLAEARTEYLRHVNDDYWKGYGNGARETVIERFDAEPDDIENDDAELMEIE